MGIIWENGAFYAPEDPPTLEDYLKVPKTFKEKVNICREVLHGIEFLQYKRDTQVALSPQSIFITKRVYIGGFSQDLSDSSEFLDRDKHVSKMGRCLLDSFLRFGKLLRFIFRDWAELNSAVEFIFTDYLSLNGITERSVKLRARSKTTNFIA